jgi:hypothetical protein
MSVSSVCQAEDGERPGGAAAGMSQRGGEAGLAGQARRADGEVVQAGRVTAGLGDDLVADLTRWLRRWRALDSRAR